MQQAWDKNGKIYYIDDNGNRIEPQLTFSPFERIGRKIQSGISNLGDFINESNPNSKAYKDKTNLALGVLTAPIGGSSTLVKLGANALKPLVGKKIAQTVSSGTVGGGTSGLVEGFGRGIVEGENPFKTAMNDALYGTLFGGGIGLGAGNIGKTLAKRKLYGDKVAQENYFNDYIADLNNKTKPMAEFRGLKEGVKGGGNRTLFDSSNPLHVKQAELINKYNPANDSYHTWIRSADDIYNFEDTLKQSDWAEYWEDSINPDYTGEMIKKAIKDGEIEVYSSYPIDKGIFVSPSRMEAEMYAGNGKVYSKRVPLDDVAWIDPTQGQYAPIREFPRPVIKDEEISISREIPPYKESNFYKQRQKRLAEKLEKENNGLYSKITDDNLKYRNEWVKIDGKDYRVLNLPKKDYGKILHILDTDLSKDIPIGDVLEKSDANYLYKFQKTSPTDYKFIGRKKLK